MAMPTSSMSKRLIIVATVGLFLAVGFLIYGHSVWVNQFVEFDDTLLIIDNISVIQAGRWSSILWAIRSYDPELYIPLTFLSLQLDAVIGGLNPFIFHLDNLLEHIINGLLVVWILQLLFKRLDVSILLGLLFLVHPLNTEAVAWASGRKDLLSTLFFLFSIAAYLQYQERGGKWGIGGVTSGVLSMLAKISTAPLPIILIVLDWLQGRALSFKSLWKKKGYFIAAILLGLIALLGKDVVLARSDPASVFLLIPRSTVFYFEKLLLPINLSILYPYEEAAVTFANPAITFSWVLLIAAVIGIWFVRKKWPTLAAGALITFLLLIPSFFQYYRGSELYLAADRYMYMPFLGVLIMLAPVLASLIDRFKKIAIGTFIALLLILSVAAFDRSGVWRNTYTLFSDALLTSESFGAYEKVGAWLLREGDREGAVKALKRSIELAPNSAAYFRLGVAAMEIGNTEAANLFNLEALKLSPENPQAHINLAKLYWDEGNQVKALEHAEKGVEYHPWNMMALGNLATMYTLTEQKQKALIVIEEILDLDPENTRVKPLLKKLEE